MRGNGHDRAGAVVDQHEVADPDGDLFAAVRIDGVVAGEYAVFDDVSGAHLLARIDHLPGFGTASVVEQLLRQWMLRRENDARSAVDGVDARGEDANFFAAAFEREVDLRTFGAADPVALHGEHALRPSAFELLVGVAQQFFGVVGDLPEPLLQCALLDRRGFVTPAAAVDHLFVREHGGALGAPVDQRLFAIRQAALEHLQEEPLVPLVVFRLAGGDLQIPVVGEAHAVHLALHLGDVRDRPIARMHAALDGRVLGGQAERVPAHGVQDVVAAHPHVARQRIADGIIAHVAHVQAAAGVGQHFDDVIFGRARSGIGGVKLGVAFQRCSHFNSIWLWSYWFWSWKLSGIGSSVCPGCAVRRRPDPPAFQE